MTVPVLVGIVVAALTAIVLAEPDRRRHAARSDKEGGDR